MLIKAGLARVKRLQAGYVFTADKGIYPRLFLGIAFIWLAGCSSAYVKELMAPLPSMASTPSDETFVVPTDLEMAAMDASFPVSLDHDSELERFYNTYAPCYSDEYANGDAFTRHRLFPEIKEKLSKLIVAAQNNRFVKFNSGLDSFYSTNFDFQANAFKVNVPGRLFWRVEDCGETRLMFDNGNVFRWLKVSDEATAKGLIEASKLGELGVEIFAQVWDKKMDSGQMYLVAYIHKVNLVGPGGKVIGRLGSDKVATVFGSNTIATLQHLHESLMPDLVSRGLVVGSQQAAVEISQYRRDGQRVCSEYYAYFDKKSGNAIGVSPTDKQRTGRVFVTGTLWNWRTNSTVDVRVDRVSFQYDNGSTVELKNFLFNGFWLSKRGGVVAPSFGWTNCVAALP